MLPYTRALFVTARPGVMFNIFRRIAGIIVCGGSGALAGWWLVQALGLSGVWAALLATAVAVVVAAGIWSAAVAVHDRMRS
jgi:hypothetical protein